MNTEHAANPERDAGGRFTSGNRGGPGNPFARQVAALRQAILDRLTPQDIQDIVDSLKKLAREGSFQAAKLLLAYAIGKPQPAPEPEPDPMDAAEGNFYREPSPMKREAAVVVGARPLMSQIMQMQVAAGLRTEMEPRPQEEGLPEEVPSTNRVAGQAPPSANGNQGAPSPNRKQRRAQRKRDRAQRKRDRAHPSANGRIG
jgi:hypothetical protein